VDEVYIVLVEKAMTDMDQVVELLSDHMDHGRYIHVLSLATEVQRAMYMLCLAWMHLWSLTVTVPASSKQDRDEFYRGRVLSSRFYLGKVFPEFFGRARGSSAGRLAGRGRYLGVPGMIQA
jgi:hypothetical protein